MLRDGSTRRDLLKIGGSLGGLSLSGCLRLSTQENSGSSDTSASTGNDTGQGNTSNDSSTTKSGVNKIFLNSRWQTPFGVNIVKSSGDLFATIGSVENGTRIEAYDRDRNSRWGLSWGSGFEIYNQEQASLTDSAFIFGGYNTAEQENQVSTGLIIALSNSDSDIRSPKWTARQEGEVTNLEATDTLCVAGTNSPEVHNESENKGRVFGYDAETGKEMWVNSKFSQEFIEGIGIHDSGVVVGTSNRVVRLDSSSGDIVDTLDKDGIFAGGLTISNDELFLSKSGAKAIDLQSNELLWRFSGVPATVTQLSPVVSRTHDQLIIATRSSRVISLEVASGEVVWQNQTPTQIIDIPRIWRQFVFVVDRSGNLKIFDLLNEGEQVAADIITSSPFAISGKTAFFGGSDNTAYSIETV